MLRRQRLFTIGLVSWFLFAFQDAGAAGGKQKHRKEGAANGATILWSNPLDIESRDLFYGPARTRPSAARHLRLRQRGPEGNQSQAGGERPGRREMEGEIGS
jgi:hypothetical protein